MFQPLQDRVLIKQAESKETSEGGIVIPATVREKPLEGTVLAVGPGRILNNGELVVPSVKEGQTVLFARDVGIETEIDGETCLIVHEPDILGIVHRKESS